MDILNFNYIKERAKKFKHNSLEYTDFDDIKDYEILCDDSNLLALYGFKNEFNMHQIHWAADELDFLMDYIKNINKEIFISFIPVQWVDTLKSNNFTEYAVFRDYWLNGLEFVPGCEEYMKLSEDECEQASKLTLSCKEQSREFFGETAEWFKEWISSDNSTDSEYKDSSVLVHKENDEMAGIVCVATYGHKSQKGAVVWIRELAVNPKFQGKGIGRKLLLQALNYGKDCGADRAFLMADECNNNAINLYKSVGFMPNEEIGQIDMVYRV